MTTNTVTSSAPANAKLAALPGRPDRRLGTMALLGRSALARAGSQPRKPRSARAGHHRRQRACAAPRGGFGPRCWRWPGWDATSCVWTSEPWTERLAVWPTCSPISTVNRMTRRSWPPCAISAPSPMGTWTRYTEASDSSRKSKRLRLIEAWLIPARKLGPSPADPCPWPAPRSWRPYPGDELPQLEPLLDGLSWSRGNAVNLVTWIRETCLRDRYRNRRNAGQLQYDGNPGGRPFPQGHHDPHHP